VPEQNSGAEVRYRTADTPWAETYGRHRAVVEVTKAAETVVVHIPWRRRDDPTEKRLIVVDAEGNNVPNILRLRIEREAADIVFGPAQAPGVYHIYYLPYPVQGGYGLYGRPYLKPEPAPDKDWLKRNRLTPDMDADARQTLQPARLIALEARTQFDSFYPMGVPLTAQEQTELLRKNTGAYLLFAEDRTFPIRMKDALPIRWRNGPRPRFSGKALRNEYYVFQVGVYAAKQELKGLSVRFSDLTGPPGNLPANALTCFNTEGVNPYGVPFTKTIDVAKGEVQALWIGVDIPEDANPGAYRGKVTVHVRNADPQPVDIELTIEAGVLADRGDGDLWRLARLRWISTTRGMGDDPIPPYPPIEMNGRTVDCLGRRVTLTKMGLPQAIACWGADILAGPVRWTIETDAGILELAASDIDVIRKTRGNVTWRSTGRADGLQVQCTATMEFDGHIDYRISLTTQKRLHAKDVRLEIPFRREIAQYMMGMGVTGGRMPEKHDWKWHGPQDSFWVGDTRGGIHCELRGSTYHGPMLNLYRPAPPPTWHNNGKGGLRVQTKSETVEAVAYSGARTLQPGKPIEFEFAFLVTPVKRLNPARQFTERYYQDSRRPGPKPEDIAAGVRIINVHHGNELNPFINYPFIANDKLKPFINHWHERGCKVKVYYTLRELTNHLPEIWFLRSLGTEVLAGGRGGGFPWLQEHLGTDYFPQWYHHFDDGTVCAALKNSGETRWYNYYVEGLAWLVENVRIDGLYLDDVSYDRRTLKRMRRVMVAANADCRIDLHSNTAFSIGPATQYTEFFPYVDKLWFGESFDYDAMSPDQWLVQVSGIPFGLMGDMLHGGGNRWLGMIYGMTPRRPWTGTKGPKDPGPVWKTWDEFGIAEARMIGYWEKDCPVRTNRDDILATAYVKPGKTLVSIGSWAKEVSSVRLEIDWEALGIDPVKAVLYAPPVENFQPEACWQPQEAIPVRPLQGWLIVITTDKPTLAEPDPAKMGRLIWEERFDDPRSLDRWRIKKSARPGTAIDVSDGTLRIDATAHSCAFIERALPGVSASTKRIASRSSRARSRRTNGSCCGWSWTRTISPSKTARRTGLGGHCFTARHGAITPARPSPSA